MGGPAPAVGDRMVDVAVVGGVLTAGPATGQIAAADKVGQRFGGGVVGVGCGRVA